MIDELHELRKANPYQSDEMAASVVLPRDDLISALRADTSRFPFLADVSDWFGFRRANRPHMPARVGWVGALAVVVLAVVAIGQWILAGETDVDLDVAEVPPTLPAELPVIPATTEVVDAVVADAMVADGAATTAPAPSSTPSTTELASSPQSTAAVASTSPATSPPSSGPESTSAPSTTTAPGTAAAPTTQPVIDGPFRAGLDLLVVHLDFAHTDDGLAALATREVTETFGLDALVVAGTASPASDGFVHPYDSLMNSAWGPGWLDGADRADAVAAAMQRWLVTLDAGGDVWVAEGGVSDFSAEVLRAVRDARPGLDTSSRVHIVQHSQRNETETIDADLAQVQGNADYVRIDDGNNANDTAGLRGSSTSFEAAALGGPRSGAWAAGFDYHSGQLDFSDTVTVLHVLGVGIDQVFDVDGFAVMFMSAS